MPRAGVAEAAAAPEAAVLAEAGAPAVAGRRPAQAASAIEAAVAMAGRAERMGLPSFRLGRDQAARNRGPGGVSHTTGIWTGLFPAARPYDYGAGAPGARASSTSAAWPLGFTFSKTRAMRPAGSMRKVVRRMPWYFRPYIDFSPQTP